MRNNNSMMVLDEKRVNTNQIACMLSIVGVIIVAIQLFFILKTGSSICPNKGCKIVENLTVVAPYLFHIIGLAFFICLTLLSFFDRKKGLLKLFLLSGLSAETIFITYQLFIIKTICLYCLAIFLLLFIINMLNGERQFLRACFIVGAGIIAASLLKYDASLFLANKNFEKGTYGIRKCSEPTRRLYLIFSKDCPHCRRVLNALKGCTQCEFRFNPIERLNGLILPDVIPSESYDPTINIITLKVLGINEVPVLIERNNKGMIFVTGDTAIISYIKKHCFSSFPSLDNTLNTEFSNQDGVCSLETECSQ